MSVAFLDFCIFHLHVHKISATRSGHVRYVILALIVDHVNVDLAVIVLVIFITVIGLVSEKVKKKAIIESKNEVHVVVLRIHAGQYVFILILN